MLTSDPHKPITFARRWLLLAGLFVTLIAACTPSSASDQITVSIFVGGEQKLVKVPAGATVQFALDQQGIALESLDRVNPPPYALLNDQDVIQVTRVQEAFEVEETTIPFERQTVRNESLPEGQTLLIQAGANGIRQDTYRILIEDGIEVSRAFFKSTTIEEARPEIVMVGVQTPFMAVPITGSLAYTSGGNAWIMRDTTGERRPLVTSGDLDGRVFSLSPDGEWLLYSRKSEGEPGESLNALWIVNTTQPSPRPINLRIQNVAHFAGWSPRSTALTFAYSTVEPRPTAPGWQANNDLHLVTITSAGNIIRSRQVIETNSGGIYGWWGTHYAWSGNGSQLAYARPDSVGLVDLEKDQLQPLLEIIPYQTRSDWAWVPPLGWSEDGSILYVVTHAAMAGLTSAEASPLFDVSAVILESGHVVELIPQSGMFAYPSPSPYLADGRFYVAVLQAIFPDQSESSRYRLLLMNQDGSNRQTVFPPSGSPGMDPQQVVWQPTTAAGNVPWLALIYQGNLWLLNVESGQAQQITGDGSIGKIDWK